MPQRFDLYWSFRSPYSYLVTGRVVAFVRTHDVDVRLRIVYPLAVRNPDYYAALPPQRRAYFRLDPPRVAAQLGMPFGPPRPDPVVIDLATRRPATEQPYIRRLSHLGVEANERGRGLGFVDEVSRLIWGGAVDGWDRGAHLAGAAQRAGLDLTAMDAAIAADPARYERLLAQNQTDLEAAGHWGVPTFVYDGEPFFGQDRFDMLVWRLAQRGLEERPREDDTPPVIRGTPSSSAPTGGLR